ncbi:amino acid permease [Candidatus Pacearchaeota archaeon]|nr:amino acid permease [Candidatus Pacearchaeota archaeon]
MVNKKFWATTFTLTGTIVGAGILGLPYIFAKSGFLIGLLWLLAIGTIMTFVNLTLGEITLRTKGRHQLTGYAEKYLGKWGKRLMLIAVIFGIYSALLAYLIGEGQSLSRLISPNISPAIFGIVFWLILTLLLRQGLRGLKKIETWGVISVITIVIGIFIRFAPQINPTNLTQISPTNFATPIGIIMFALLGFVAIPELKQEIKGQEHLLKKAIIFGSIIPIFLYAIFTLTFVGVLGNSITEVATLSFGPIITILGIFTMFTAYFALSYTLNDTFRQDFKTTKTTNFILTSIIPLVLYVLTEYFQIISFTSILGIGGAISAGITGILILLIAKKAKLSINTPILITLSIFFIASIILELIK